MLKKRGPVTRAENEIRGSGRILVVEDNDLVRSQVAMQLEALGYDVVQARKRIRCVGHTGEWRTFELIFTDIVMPGGMNG